MSGDVVRPLTGRQLFPFRLATCAAGALAPPFVTDERARLAVVLQRIAPDLVAALWRVRELRELPLETRETIADLLGNEAASRGLDEDEEPNAYGEELGELFEALGL